MVPVGIFSVIFDVVGAAVLRNGEIISRISGNLSSRSNQVHCSDCRIRA